MTLAQHLRPLALAAGWAATRGPLLWLLAHDYLGLFGGGGLGREVYHLYARWYDVLADGGLPRADPLWQYPPGAGPLLLAPGTLPGLTYFQGFVLLALAADAVVAAALVRAGALPGRSMRGAVLWTAALPLLLHLPLVRYDVPASAFAVLSLLALPRSPRACGAWAAAGALVKGWPALALIGTPKGRGTRAASASALVTGVVLLGALTVLFRDPLGFLRAQGGRGVQIESLGGTVLAFAHRAGLPGKVRYRYGAMEFTGPYVAAVAAGSLALTALALGALLVWRARARHWSPATPYDAALCAVLLFTVTSRVISPQYMVWLLGLAAVCLTSRHTRQGPVAALVVAAAALSAVAYPGLYDEVVGGTWTGCLLMLARNGLLAAAAVWSLVRLHRGTAVRPEPPGPARPHPRGPEPTALPASLPDGR